MTWTDVVGLVIYLELEQILKAQIASDGTIALDNPQLSNPREGVCFVNPQPGSRWFYYRVVEGRQDLTILINTPPNPVFNFVSSATGEHCVTLQNYVIRAVVKQIHTICSARDYTNYQGTCSEDRLIDYLEGIEAWYTDKRVWQGNGVFGDRGNVVSATAAYAFLAQQVINNFEYDGQNPNPEWPLCPCNWGNVGDVDAARTGVPSIDRVLRDQNDQPILDANGQQQLVSTRLYSYAYLLFDEGRASTAYRYFMIR